MPGLLAFAVVVAACATPGAIAVDDDVLDDDVLEDAGAGGGAACAAAPPAGAQANTAPSAAPYSRVLRELRQPVGLWRPLNVPFILFSTPNPAPHRRGRLLRTLR